MIYKEFTVTTTDEAQDLVADIFWDFTDFGVAISSLKDVIELTKNRRETFDYLESSLSSGIEGVALVKGYFPCDEAEKYLSEVTKRLDLLKERSSGFLDTGSLEVVTRDVDGEDWIEIWRKHFKPIHFSKITICPEWVNCDCSGPVALIGSNTAFGTGEHETTSMCIEFLEKYLKPDQTIIDVGTGSGILGIVSAKLGAKTVYMTDIDPKAVEAAKYNVGINGVNDKCFPCMADLVTGLNVKGDLVVANLTAEILYLLSKDIVDFTKEGSVLIMSGILKDRIDKVVNVYKPLGFTFIDRRISGEWSALVAIRQK